MSKLTDEEALHIGPSLPIASCFAHKRVKNAGFIYYPIRGRQQLSKDFEWRRMTRDFFSRLYPKISWGDGKFLLVLMPHFSLSWVIPEQ